MWLSQEFACHENGVCPTFCDDRVRLFRIRDQPDCPVACAASAATIDQLRDVIPAVPGKAAHATQRFAAMSERYATIGAVRGLGLMLGVELVDREGKPDRSAFESVASVAFESGLSILPCGPDGNVIRFIPPLNVSPEQLDQGIDIIENALKDHESSGLPSS